MAIERLDGIVETSNTRAFADSNADALFSTTSDDTRFEFVKEVSLDGRGVFFSCAMVVRPPGDEILMCIHRRDALNIEVHRESDMQLFDPDSLEPLSEHYTTFAHVEDPRIVVLNGSVYVIDNYQSDMMAHEIDVSGDIPTPTGIRFCR